MKSLLIGESPAGSESSFFRKTWGTWKTAAAVSSAAVVFGVAILVLSILAAISPLKVFPQTDPATESAATVQIEYYLPYPGVLPDSPLYKLKMVRDRVKLWITRDATRNAMRPEAGATRIADMNKETNSSEPANWKPTTPQIQPGIAKSQPILFARAPCAS